MRLNLLPHPGSSSDSVIWTSLLVSCDKGTVSQVKKKYQLQLAALEDSWSLQEPKGDMREPYELRKVVCMAGALHGRGAFLPTTLGIAWYTRHLLLFLQRS